MKLPFLKIKKREVHFAKEKKILIGNTGYYWTILLAVFFAIVVVLLALNTYILYQINHNGLFTVPNDSEAHVPKVNEKRLQAVLDYFDKRAQNTDATLKQKPAVVDPSL